MSDKNVLFYKDMYDKLYKLGYHSSKNTSHTIPVLQILFKNKIKFNSVLDCGSSIGNAILFLKTKKIKAQGIEISQIATEIANKRGLPTIQGSITNLPFKNNLYELVITCDVLEHLKEDDVSISIGEMLRVSKKYVCIKSCSHPEHNKKPLNKLKDIHPKYKNIENLHLTTKKLSWYIDLIKKFKNVYKFKIHKNLIDSGIILVEKI